MNVLYLISKSHRPSPQIFSTPKPDKIFLCVVEYGCETILKEVSDILSRRNILYETVDFLQLFNDNAFRHKDDFLRYIHDLGNKKIGGRDQGTWKDFYQLPGENFSAWWLSLVYEKNPYKSDAYSRWTRIRTIIELKKNKAVDQIWIDPRLEDIGTVLQCSSLADAVVSLDQPSWKTRVKGSERVIFLVEKIRAFKFITELVFKIALLKISFLFFRRRTARLKTSQFLLLTMFPLLDAKALEEGTFINRAYGPLQKVVSQQTQGAFTWLGMFTPTHMAEVPKLIRAAGKVIRGGENFFFYEEFLGFRGLLKVIRYYTVFLFKTFFNLDSIRGQFEYEVDGVKLDLWDLWKRDVISSFAGKNLCTNLSFYFSFPPVLSKLPPGASVLYFSEMHAWDHALNANVRKYKDLTSIGLQHTIVPLLLMTYFRDPRELKEGNDFTHYLPSPHRLGCTGEIVAKMFLDDGWDPRKIFIMGGFRFESIGAKLIKGPAARSPRKNQVVAALSISDAENEEILYMLYDAFNDNKSNVRILIKPHPLNDVKQAIERLGLQLNPVVFEITDRPLGEIVPESKAMIVKESSSIFEALAADVPVIVPSLYSIIDLCPLSKISDLPVYVKSADDLVRAVEGSAGNGNKGREFVKKYLHILDKEDNYWHNLKKAIAGVGHKEDGI